MTNEQILRSVTPADLAPARAIAHRAAQHLTRAARANLPAEPDDSQSNLGWDSERQAFLSHPLNGTFVGLSLVPLTMFLFGDDERSPVLALDNKTEGQLSHWLDERLTEFGLNKASNIALPYELPTDVTAVTSYDSKSTASLSALAHWFDATAVTLDKFVKANAAIRPGPSPARCWPHHFDLATYVSFETGDPETTRGMGIGLSPGDEGFNEPYLYINPWPHLDANTLPDPVAPGHWHTQGYVGLIATATELSTCDHIGNAISEFVYAAFDTARKAQGL